MPLHRKLVATTAIPTSLAIALLYLSSISPTRSDGLWLFRVGITIMIAAGLVCWLTILDHQFHRLRNWSETTVASIQRHQRTQDHRLDTLQARLDQEKIQTAIDQAATRLAQRRPSRLQAIPNQKGLSDGVG